ncbi:hypothetical protein BH11VER1_BH11VER1_01660 [soil metagenome]
MLKPHDIVVSLKLLESKGSDSAPTYAALSHALRLSPSEVHASVTRGIVAGLLKKPLPNSKRTMPEPIAVALREFLVHGLKYVWPAKRGAITRGIPTGSSVESVSDLMEVAAPAVPLVWPHVEGTVRGESIEPLYARAGEACINDPVLYEWLALIDVVRLKTGREAALASAAIEKRLA